MSSDEPRYALARADPAAERARLEKLEQINDDASLRRIDALGVAVGARCLEVGAGAGSIARALAQRTGVGGCVVAADMDPRFLDDFSGPGRLVVTHDITEGPVPPADFDFVHCRAVLAHVADLPTAVRHLLHCARPGGVVLSEEPDYGAIEPCDPEHPRAKVFSEYLAGMRRGDRMDPHAGRNVYQAFCDAGLEDIRCDAVTAIVTGGSFRALYRKHTMENVREMAIASGGHTASSLQALFDCFDDPSFRYVDNLWVGTSGRIPR